MANASHRRRVIYPFDNKRPKLRPYPRAALWLSPRDLNMGMGIGIASYTDRITGTALAQGTAARQPTYQRGLNCQPSVRFDGTDDLLGTAAFPTALGPTAKTVVMVISTSAAIAAAKVIICNGTANWYTGVTGTNRHLSSHINEAAAQKTTNGTNAVILVGRAYVFSYRWAVSGSDVVVSIRLNGLDITTAGVFTDGITTATSLTVNLGAFSQGNNHFPGDIGDVLVYNSALTDAQLIETEQYLYQDYLIDR